MQTRNDVTQSADKVAIGLSFVCAIHCLLLPIAIAILPSAALFGLNDEWFHRMLLVIVLPISAYALMSGLKKHRNVAVLSIGIAGLFVLILAAMIGHEAFGEIGERLVTVLGSMLVALSHLRNFQLCQLRAPEIASE